MLSVVVFMGLMACSKKQQSQEQNQPGNNAGTVSSASPTSLAENTAAPAAATPPPRSSGGQEQRSGMAGEAPKAEMAKHVEPPAPPPPLVVPSGASLIVRMGETISSKTAQPGQAFSGTLAKAVAVNGDVAIPEGSSVHGTVVNAKSPGKFKGEGVLSITLNSITVRGVPYDITTSNHTVTVKGKGKRTAVAVGGGTGAGALIGGIAGGGKGAAIGALVGAGAGTAGAAYTGNKELVIPTETAVTFQLGSSLTVQRQPRPNAVQ